MIESSPVTRLRLRSPADVVTAVPLLLGFHPQHSVVAISLRGPRSQVGLVMRVDLPPGPPVRGQVFAQLAARMAGDGADSALVVFYPPGGGRPDGTVADGLAEALDDHGVLLRDALVVGGGRWWSLQCSDDSCCPAEGTPVAAIDDPAATDVTAAAALGGLAALPDRQALVASLAPLSAPASEGMARALAAATARRAGQASSQAARAEDLDRWRAAVAASTERRVALSDAEAAELILAVTDIGLRDEVITWATGARGEPLERLLRWLVPRALPPADPAVCSILAWVAYQRGDGAVARVALDRALASDPAHSLAQLLVTALDGGVPPAQLRRTALLLRGRPAGPARRRSRRAG